MVRGRDLRAVAGAGGRLGGLGVRHLQAQLFTIFKTPALEELLGKGSTNLNWHANVAFALFLVGGAVGGIGFGVLGDRIGRVRVMSLTILIYSIFSALTFFVRSVWELEALRFLVALGTGGEWAIAAALVAETFPPPARAFASGIFHASSVLGPARSGIADGRVPGLAGCPALGLPARPGAGCWSSGSG